MQEFEIYQSFKYKWLYPILSLKIQIYPILS